jgi:hypothetical protein
MVSSFYAKKKSKAEKQLTRHSSIKTLALANGQMDLKTSRTHFDNIKNYFTQFLILFMF